MWRLLRRDAVSVWSNETVKKRLARYRAIIDLALPARFKIARSIEVEFDSSKSLDELWQIHKDGRRRFEELLLTMKTEVTSEIKPLAKKSFLDLKVLIANRMLQQCNFCERQCDIDRTTQTGFCGVSNDTYIASAFLHTGEEAPLIPSGTIFFSGCNFRCAHCQNFDISTNPTCGNKISAEKLSAIADELASQGAKNINYVGGDPTPNLHTILASMTNQQYNITQLWNSNMYLTLESMELLIDVIDFWLPDLKYFSNECSRRISDVSEYFKVVSRNIHHAYEKGSKEMIIRLLVLPNHLDCCVFPILEWIADKTPKALVNIMSQYRPLWRVIRNPKKFSDISRRVSREEMEKVFAHAEHLGIEFRSVS